MFVECRMAFAFEGQGNHAFSVRTHPINDPLDGVPEEGYFTPGRRHLRPGDLISVGTAPLPNPPRWLNRPQETRRALLMIGPIERDRPISARLVQDFGRPEDPSAPFRPSKPMEPRGGR